MAPKATRRRLRVAAINAGFSAAHRLQQLGLAPFTWRARRLVARVAGDHFATEVAGATIGGSLIDHGAYLRWLARGGPHPFELQLFTDALAPEMVVVDCGAHIGLYSVLAGRGVGPRGRVFAVEPDAPNAKALRANVVANRLGDRVEVVEAAASNRAGTERLYPNLSPHWGSSMRALGSLLPHPEIDQGSVEVRTVRLDDVLAGRRVDVAKVDVEGAEALALEGMRETVARSEGAVVFIECHPAALERAGTSPARWLDQLRDAGTLELIDEAQGRLVPATAEVISGRLDERTELPFNLRWTVG